MKISWGTGIALVYSLFAGAMLTAVFMSRRYDPGLVDKNYYDLDLKYQARLEKKQNTAKLSTLPQITADQQGNTLLVQFPDGMQVRSGNCKFFRAAEVGDDFSVAINPDNHGKVMVPTAQLHKGRWHIELEWEADGGPYYYTTTFDI